MIGLRLGHLGDDPFRKDLSRIRTFDDSPRAHHGAPRRHVPADDRVRAHRHAVPNFYWPVDHGTRRHIDIVPERRSATVRGSDISGGVNATERADARGVIHDDASIVRDGKPWAEDAGRYRNSSTDRLPRKSQSAKCPAQSAKPVPPSGEVLDPSQKRLVIHLGVPVPVPPAPAIESLRPEIKFYESGIREPVNDPLMHAPNIADQRERQPGTTTRSDTTSRRN